MARTKLIESVKKMTLNKKKMSVRKICVDMISVACQQTFVMKPINLKHFYKMNQDFL